MSDTAVQEPEPAGWSTGTLLIAGIFVASLLAAGASWWFRFAATHRAARFWGPEAAVLIRDAPVVELLTLRPAAGRLIDGVAAGSVETVLLGDQAWHAVVRRDVSDARGMLHLRNALLEDRSFVWPARDDVPEAMWSWGLRFRDPFQSAAVTVWLSSDCRLATRVGESLRDSQSRLGETRPRTQALSCEPIADGLRTFLAELTPGQGAPAR